jgi:hypothetical protein
MLVANTSTLETEPSDADALSHFFLVVALTLFCIGTLGTLVLQRTPPRPAAHVVALPPAKLRRGRGIRRKKQVPSIRADDVTLDHDDNSSSSSSDDAGEALLRNENSGSTPTCADDDDDKRPLLLLHIPPTVDPFVDEDDGAVGQMLVAPAHALDIFGRQLFLNINFLLLFVTLAIEDG